MALKQYFSGETGKKLWLNVLLMVLLVIAVPVLTFFLLDVFTHHGEKIEVPHVVGKSIEDAESMLEDRDLVAVVVDSAYEPSARPGTVLDQSPKAGNEVKGGRVVYLTMNLKGAPMVQLPDVVSQGSLRQAVALLESLGFKLTPHERVMGQPEDLVISVKQGRKTVHAGQMVPRDQRLTIVVGGGMIDTSRVEQQEDSVIAEDDFDIEQL